MAIGTTRVWVVGEILSAANMNTFLSTILGDLAGRNGAILLENALEVVGGSGKYFRVPSLTTTERDALTPQDGYQVYNSTLSNMQFREGGAWLSLSSGLHAADHLSGGSDVLTGTLAASAITPTSGNLTLSVAAGADVLIGDDVTIIYVDGGENAIGLGAAPLTSSFSHVLMEAPAITLAVNKVAQRAIVNNASAITTAGSGTHGMIASLVVWEPNIIIGTAGVTNAVSLYIPSVPTEGVNNYALWVDAGASRFDGTVTIGDDITLSKSGVTITGSAGGINLNPATSLIVNSNILETTRSHSGNEVRITSTNTSNTTSSRATIEAIVAGATAQDPTVSFVISGVQTWRMGIDNDEADRFVIGEGTFATNDALRITATGRAITFDDSIGSDFDYTCDRCGSSKLDPFLCCGVVSWHDDVLALREMRKSAKGLEHMVKLGVYEVDGPMESPTWVGINYQKGMHMTWSGMWQLREMIDNLEQRLTTLEK